MNSSNLLIISHDKEEFTLLGDVLKWYFPGGNDGDKKNSNDRLMIKNKYYQAEVKMSSMLWQQTQLFAYNTINDQKEYEALSLQSQSINQIKPQKQQLKQQVQLPENINSNKNNQLEQANKYDLMIMLVNEQNQEQISFNQLDALIETINPQEFVLLVNTERPGDVWKQEEVILEKCNNFIEIVKDDLQQVAKNKPQWGRGALLNDDDEETVDSGVFSILDRMETTRWRNMVDMKSIKEQSINEEMMMKVKQQKKVEKEEIQTEQFNENTLQKKQPQQSFEKQQQQSNENPPHQQLTTITSTEQKQQPNSSDEQQQKQKHQQQLLDEDQLQAEMLQFEEMMSQMISFKAQSSNMKDSERKIKAQELFIKMFEKMNY